MVSDYAYSYVNNSASCAILHEVAHCNIRTVVSNLSIKVNRKCK